MSDCPHDPRSLAGQPIGMYHCPECGEMVLAGMAHPDYRLLEKKMSSYDERAVALFLEAVTREPRAVVPGVVATLTKKALEKSTGPLSAEETACGYLIDEFEALSNWEKANVLFRLADWVRNDVALAAKFYVGLAREEDKVEGAPATCCGGIPLVDGEFEK